MSGGLVFEGYVVGFKVVHELQGVGRDHKCIAVGLVGKVDA